MDNASKTGSKSEFESNWSSREEVAYNHWTIGSPKNQVQLAFRCHWEVFNELISDSCQTSGDILEVGCGRGSLSSYFVENGWNATMLDCSESVLNTARVIFAHNGHHAEFIEGDANSLPFSENEFDVVASIGLLEHFEEVRKPIEEQLRVLKPGGWFLGYIVPERPDNIQRYFNWINWTLRKVTKVFGRRQEQQSEKVPIYRSDNFSSHYIKAIDGLRYDNLKVFGMYSLPMISHSPEFPFSLLHPLAELFLTRVFQCVLAIRKLITRHHGWICTEQMGHAFLVAFQKPRD